MARNMTKGRTLMEKMVQNPIGDLFLQIMFCLAVIGFVPLGLMIFNGLRFGWWWVVVLNGLSLYYIWRENRNYHSQRESVIK